MKNRKCVLVDASNIHSGGAVQVALSFIIRSLETSEFSFKYILNSYLYHQVSEHVSMKDCIVVNTSSMSHADLIHTSLAYEKLCNPCLVFTIFGPSRIKFKSLHVTGFANGWVSHSTIRDFINVNGISFRLLFSLLKYAYLAFKLRTAQYYILETEVARDGLCKRLCLAKEKTFIVPNSYPHNFGEYSFSPVNLENRSILILSAYYKHKNLESLPFVAKSLASLGCREFKFYLTLKSEQYINIVKLAKKMDVDDMFINLGPVNINQLPSLYNKMSIIYSPSNLETFSAVCLESLVARRPLLLNDKPFFRTICDDAAFYVDSNCYQSVAKQIIDIFNCPKLVEDKLNKYGDVLSRYPSSSGKFNKYISILKKVSNEASSTKY